MKWDRFGETRLFFNFGSAVNEVYLFDWGESLIKVT
jgi:hypothetical protein